MRDRDLYAQILGLTAPWKVTQVDLDLEEETVEVHVAAREATRLPCPQCGESCSRYDHRVRRWRHLDTCQYRTILVAKVPRVKCPEHGIHQIDVPWGESGSRFTALFEAIAIDWLREANISAVARRLNLSWDEVDGIMQRAVRRGLDRRVPLELQRIGIDETSFQKRHEYVTVVTNLETGKVVHVGDDRTKAAASQFFERLTPEQLESIEVVAMDMWEAYIGATRLYLEDADRKIAFDKFHVAKHLGDAVDKVRRQEHRDLTRRGDYTLLGTRHLWLQNPENMTERSHTALELYLKEAALRTARAWAIKEHGMSLWHYDSPRWAEKAWKGWLAWAVRSRLEPIKKVASMIREHLWGIVNAIVLKATNAASESVNAKIQRVKRMACGFRNRRRFRDAIYFHLGGLDLYPATHTKP